MPDTSAATALIELALERARYEYTELAENWKQLDTKAQGTGALSGVFLAAVFAFGQQNSPLLAIVAVKAMAIGLILLLTGAILCAVLCLWTREAQMPPDAETVRDQVKAFLGADLDDEARLAEREALLAGFLDDWVAANATLSARNAAKSRWLTRAQVLLVAGAAISAVLTCVRVLA
jgi:multisubunit Na+/H+ antiporter MnhG subunit